MLVGDDVIRDFALRMEGEFHKGGWDQPHRIFELHGQTVSGTRAIVAAFELPVPDYIRDAVGGTGGLMSALGDFYTRCPVELARYMKTSARSTFVGHCLVSEAWLNDQITRVDDKRKLADIPGSVEVRQVSIVDTSGRYVHVMRRRGERPTDYIIRHKQQTEPFSNIGGRIPRGLQAMTLAVAKRCPLGTANLDAIANVIETDEETWRRNMAARGV